jgi:preprotein translocase subunit SecG
MLDGLIMALLMLTSIFLILLVLVQRGRGGGLAGAFGGLGGQSAFGTKAGDLFTRITIFTAAFWIILCAFSVKWFSDASRNVIEPGLGGAATSQTPGGAKQGANAKPGAAGPRTTPATPGAGDAKATPGATPPPGAAGKGASDKEK